MGASKERIRFPDVTLGSLSQACRASRRRVRALDRADIGLHFDRKKDPEAKSPKAQESAINLMKLV